MSTKNSMIHSKITHNMLIKINSYLLSPVNYNLNKNIKRQNLWEYLLYTNKHFNKLSFQYCYHVCQEKLKDTITPFKVNNYRESVKVYRHLSLSVLPIKFIVYYNHSKKHHYYSNNISENKPNKIWEVYPPLQICSQDIEKIIIKLIALLTNNLITTYEIDNECVNNKISYINWKRWNYFNNILTTYFGITIPKPKKGDTIVCDYQVKFPMISEVLSKNAYINHKVSNLNINLTKNTIIYLNENNLIHIIVNNIECHIDECEYYDELYGDCDPSLSSYICAKKQLL